MRRAVLLLAAMALALLLASGVAWAVTKVGGPGHDTLTGTNGADNLLGKGGDDTIFGLRGSDNLLGGGGDDIVIGGKPPATPLGGGSKNVYGGSGNDFVGGGNGPDNVVGGDGIDYVADGDVVKDTSIDIVSAGGGNDGVQVVNATPTRDIVSCGSGFDRVAADRKDVIAPDCERVFFGSSPAAAARFFGSFPPSFFETVPFPGDVGA
jgi:RTX calcium-binding nonapeptide repeat (4 copies)